MAKQEAAQYQEEAKVHKQNVKQLQKELKCERERSAELTQRASEVETFDVKPPKMSPKTPPEKSQIECKIEGDRGYIQLISDRSGTFKSMQSLSNEFFRQSTGNSIQRYYPPSLSSTSISQFPSFPSVRCKACKTGCNRGYCGCYKSGNGCSSSCGCTDCSNPLGNRNVVSKTTAVESSFLNIERESFRSLQPRAREYDYTSLTSTTFSRNSGVSRYSGVSGVSCKACKTGCNRGYCSCYKNGSGCSSFCGCTGCSNPLGSH